MKILIRPLLLFCFSSRKHGSSGTIGGSSVRGLEAVLMLKKEMILCQNLPVFSTGNPGRDFYLLPLIHPIDNVAFSELLPFQNGSDC